jgi:DNA-binding NarL/FixJ family response regulator
MASYLTCSGDRRAVVLDARALWADAVGGLLTRAGIAAVAKATTWPAALALVDELGAHLLVADLDTADRIDAAEWVRHAKERSPRLRVIAMSMDEDLGLIDAVLRVGASAFVLKTAQPEDLMSAVQQVFHRSVYFAEGAPVADPAASMAHFGIVLTRRERQILELVSEGYANSEIAHALRVAEQTVKFHLSNTYRKLGVANRTEATRWAHVHGLLAPRSANGEGSSGAIRVLTPAAAARRATAHP